MILFPSRLIEGPAYLTDMYYLIHTQHKMRHVVVIGRPILSFPCTTFLNNLVFKKLKVVSSDTII